MPLSIVVPFNNEEKNVTNTVNKIYHFLGDNKIKGEIVAIDDRSTDNTGKILDSLKKTVKNLSVVHRIGNPEEIEIGYAIRDGIKAAKYSTITIMMGDMSDDPNDVIKMLNKIDEGYDIVCGSRLIKGSIVTNYPMLKLIMMKLYNKLFSFLFNLPVNDFSNAFKTYRRSVFKKVKLESKEFEVTAEMLIKAYIVGFRITEVPVNWVNRKSGKSKLGLFNISFRFLFYQLPRIGLRYCATAMKLYLQYVFSKFR